MPPSQSRRVVPVPHEVDGVTLRTVDTGPAGADRTFVLIHGIGMSHHTFSPLAAALKRHGRVIGVDLAGFGANLRPRGRVSIEDHARQVELVLRERGVTKALVVGHSMGSQVVVELARRAPALVEGAVLIGPVVDPERPGAVLQGLALLRDCLREPVGVDALLLADYLRSLRWYLRQLPEMLHHPVQERLAEVTRPVLIVRGRRDPIATRDWCERLLARAQDGRLVEAAASRHVVPRTEPGWLAEQLVRFADAVGVAPAPAPASAAAAAAAEEAAA